MFVRGGVYRVVKEAMGGTLAKLSVSALMFDYVLTGPISGVSAGQYIVGLLNELLVVLHAPFSLPPGAASAAIAIAITLYFWRQNILGIEESSDKAMKIMGVTTVMIVVMIVWCGITIWMRGATLPPFAAAVQQRLAGLAGGLGVAEARSGAIGIVIAFGHSILAMSGEESLAQVNREIALSKGAESDSHRVHHLPLQHAHDRADFVLRRPDHPRRSAHERIQRQSHRRAGDVRRRSAVGAPGASGCSS